MKNVVSAALSVLTFGLLTSLVFPLGPLALSAASDIDGDGLAQLTDAEMAAVVGGGWKGAACDAMDNTSRTFIRWGRFLGWDRIVGEGAKIRGVWSAYCV